MTLDRADRGIVNRLIARAVALAHKRNLLLFVPRRAEFALQDIAVGTQVVAVSWTVPIAHDYAVVVVPTSAAAFVGLLSATPQAASKTPHGCNVIVANRSAQTIGVATFDVLAFPLGEG